jgi:hypothetical protein
MAILSEHCFTGRGKSLKIYHMALDLSYYHSTQEVLQGFTRLADPSRCGARLTVDNLRDNEDPSFGLLTATFADVNERTSQSPRGKAHVLLNFGAHGRELISSEVALRLASMLCGESPSLFDDGSAESSRRAITELLRHVDIKMVPVQVPSSRKLAETASGTCIQRRLNGRGVDVNRNWDVAWAEGEASAGSSQYRGPRPFSEPETRALARLAQDWRPDLFVDVRSGDRYMAMPYASRASGPTDRNDRTAMLDAMRQVTSMLSRSYPQLVRGGVPYGPASSLGEEPYRAAGTALDWMYSQANVRRAYMFEVYGASTVYGVAGRGEQAIDRTPSAVVSFLQGAEGPLAEGEAGQNVSSARGTVVAARNRTDVGGVSRRLGGRILAGRNNESRALRDVSDSSRNASSNGGDAVLNSSSIMASRDQIKGRTGHAMDASSSDDDADTPQEPRARITLQQRKRRQRQRRRRQELMSSAKELAPTVLLSLDEGGGQAAEPLVEKDERGGMSAGLGAEERPFDCVAFFNPTSFSEYEATVNGWADALLVMIREASQQAGAVEHN